MRRTWMAVLCVAGWACAVEPDVDEGGGPGSTAADDDAGTTAGTSEDDGQTSLPPPEESSEGEEGEESSTGCSFIGCEDTDTGCGGGGAACECDVWSNDCNEGEKCMPWANDGGSSWNATKCVPLVENPGQPGDACTVEGSGVSGFDDCTESSMCWDVDEEGNGTCVAFCSGNEASPVCEDPDTTCVIANDGVLNLCLPVCDPLMPICAEGQACYPSGDTFVCVFDASADAGAYGDPCEFTNVCDPGLWCAGAGGVPNCPTEFCCTSFCDLSDPDASASCPGAAGGQQCVAWYEEGQVPPMYEDVGACLIPE